MDKSKIVGVITATIAVFAFIALLNSGNNTPLLHLPTEAYFNLAFAVGWMTRAPAWLAYLIAIILFVMVAVGFYALGYWLFKQLKK